MNVTLNLTFEDGLKVVEAMREVAINNGWDAEELDECGVIDEYSQVVDAALSAMGFNVKIEGAPVEDEDEDEDFSFNEDDFDFDDDDECEEEDDDEEDDMAYYGLTVKGEFVLRCVEAGYPFSEACEIADLLFDEEDGE